MHPCITIARTAAAALVTKQAMPGRRWGETRWLPIMQAVKAEEPKLEQAVKTEVTGAGGAGTAAPAAPAAPTAGVPQHLCACALSDHETANFAPSTCRLADICPAWTLLVAECCKDHITVMRGECALHEPRSC